jgi:hypothetical protein
MTEKVRFSVSRICVVTSFVMAFTSGMILCACPGCPAIGVGLALVALWLRKGLEPLGPLLVLLVGLAMTGMHTWEEFSLPGCRSARNRAAPAERNEPDSKSNEFASGRSSYDHQPQPMTRTTPGASSASWAPTSPRPSPPAWAGRRGSRLRRSATPPVPRFDSANRTLSWSDWWAESSFDSWRRPLLGGEVLGEGGPTSILPALPRAVNFAESSRTTPS